MQHPRFPILCHPRQHTLLQASSNLVNPLFSTACVESFPPKVIGSRLVVPVNHAYQEQIVAGRTTQNIVGSLSVPGQVILQEIPKVQVIERTQEQIVE